jgi:hypothetical protein
MISQPDIITTMRIPTTPPTTPPIIPPTSSGDSPFDIGVDVVVADGERLDVATEMAADVADVLPTPFVCTLTSGLK